MPDELRPAAEGGGDVVAVARLPGGRARRVVASNWLVDDEAAASLVSIYCTLLAKAEKQGGPADYARSLHAAKRGCGAGGSGRPPTTGPASSSSGRPDPNTVGLAVRYVRNRVSNYSPLTKGGYRGGSGRGNPAVLGRKITPPTPPSQGGGGENSQSPPRRQVTANSTVLAPTLTKTAGATPAQARIVRYQLRGWPVRQAQIA